MGDTKKAKDAAADDAEVPSDLDFSLKTALFGANFGVGSVEFLETIGLHSVGRVRLVRTHSDMKFYSLKMMKKAVIVELNQIQHALNEVHILSRLRCIFVPELYAVFQDENTLYTLSEYVPGGELFSHLRRQEVFDHIIYQFYAVEIACAMKYLHELNILYRGIKPENIAITRSGHIRLMDFSFSKIFDTEKRTFTLCGTPEYCAPEILGGSGYGLASDWWAFGILIFEMAYGYPCFFGENPFSIYKQIIAGNIIFPPEKPIPLSAQDLIKKLLIEDRSLRLGSGKSGFSGVKSHSFFSGMDWTSASGELISPPAAPTVSDSDGDTSNYDFYPEDDSEEVNTMTYGERKEFEGFDRILNRKRGL